MRCFAYQWVTLGFISISENWVKSIFCLTEIFERHKCSGTNSFLLYQRKCKKNQTLTLNELTLDLVWCIWKYRLTHTVNTSFISVSPPPRLWRQTLSWCQPAKLHEQSAEHVCSHQLIWSSSYTSWSWEQVLCRTNYTRNVTSFPSSLSHLKIIRVQLLYYKHTGINLIRYRKADRKKLKYLIRGSSTMSSQIALAHTTFFSGNTWEDNHGYLEPLGFQLLSKRFSCVASKEVSAHRCHSHPRISTSFSQQLQEVWLQAKGLHEHWRTFPTIFLDRQEGPRGRALAMLHLSFQFRTSRAGRSSEWTS